jgi:hypothetical protein
MKKSEILELEKEFIPYDLALKMKFLGFKEPCFGFHYVNPINNSYTEFKYGMAIFKITSSEITKGHILAPTFSQCFNWFRKNHMLSGAVIPTTINHSNDTMQYTYDIRGKYTTCVEIGDMYEAQLECLKKIVDLVYLKTIHEIISES